ncbi:MAG: WD40 repeat domain-containing protein, partial [Pyrinomonadaceae bacterium]
MGKSSVLRAGVAHDLVERARENIADSEAPEFAVVVFSSWRDDPLAKLNDSLRDSFSRLYNGRGVEPVPASPSLTETLRGWSERVDGELLIILDQFEEYFLYHAREDGEGSFAVEFPRAVNAPDLRASFLVSMREDTLAQLDCFKGRIPNLFDNYLRIDHLGGEAARDAINKPITQFNRLREGRGRPVSIEPELVEAVLSQVRTGGVRIGAGGQGVVGGQDAEAQVETPYLQLVMSRLWDEETCAGSRELRLETLNRLGGAQRIVRTHLDAALGALPPWEQEVASRAFNYLVTPSGTKISHSVSDLAYFTQLKEARLTPVLNKLADVRGILRPVAPPPDRPD